MLIAYELVEIVTTQVIYVQREPLSYLSLGRF